MKIRKICADKADKIKSYAKYKSLIIISCLCTLVLINLGIIKMEELRKNNNHPFTYIEDIYGDIDISSIDKEEYINRSMVMGTNVQEDIVATLATEYETVCAYHDVSSSDKVEEYFIVLEKGGHAEAKIENVHVKLGLHMLGINDKYYIADLGFVEFESVSKLNKVKLNHEKIWYDDLSSYPSSELNFYSSAYVQIDAGNGWVKHGESVSLGITIDFNYLREYDGLKYK